MSIEILYAHYNPPWQSTQSLSTNRRLNQEFTCPGCGSISNTYNTVLMPEGAKHYAAAKCSSCDAFLRWLPKPQNEGKRNERSQVIQSWLSNPKASLNDWERGFLQSIAKAKTLSPKQQECFNKIYNRLGCAV